MESSSRLFPNVCKLTKKKREALVVERERCVRTKGRIDDYVEMGPRRLRDAVLGGCGELKGASLYLYEAVAKRYEYLLIYSRRASKDKSVFDFSRRRWLACCLKAGATAATVDVLL